MGDLTAPHEPGEAPWGVAVLLKHVDLHPRVDPLTGLAEPTPHGGASAADRAALELALRIGEATAHSVLAVTAGPGEADATLRDALAVGAHTAIRVALPASATSEEVARGLAPLVAGCGFVVCGDVSDDRGSGSVPAFLAGLLGRPQALGLVEASVTDAGIDGQRRLDGGRRDLITVAAPAVISVEPSVARLRRAALDGVLGARRAAVAVVIPHSVGAGGRGPGRVLPFRPRARVLPGPDQALSPRERLLSLTGALTHRDPPRVVHADTAQAAREILEFLAARGLR